MVQKMEENTITMLDRQMGEKRQKELELYREKIALKEKLNTEYEFYTAIEKDHKALRTFMVVENKKEIKDQWKTDQKRRFHESTLPMDEFEEKRNKEFLDQAGLSV